MKTKEQRFSELYSSGLVNSIKELFSNRSDISEEYYVLMADYIDSMNEMKDQMLINPTEIARKMPELVKSIQETNLGGIYGRTDDNRIQMEQSLSYEDKKLYFFHELTHALQTSHENGREQCGFYNGHDGMFLTEGATQYTAEMLYNVSNDTNLEHRQQHGKVRGASNRTTNSPLSEYQYNGDVLELMAKSMDLPLPQVLALAYKKDARETLKGIYESMDGNQGKFDELMNNLEQIYSIDNLLIHGYGQQLQSQTPLNITMQDGVTRFKGNLSTYRELMDKTERELVATYLENHDTEYILQNYDEVAQFLTTPDLKNNFLAAVHELGDLSQDNRSNNIMNLEDYRRNRVQETQVPQMPQMEMPEGYSINEYGEIIRPTRNEEIKQFLSQSQEQIYRNTRFGAVITPNSYSEHLQLISQQNGDKLSIKQRVAQFLQKHNLFMNMSFVDKFVHNQLDVLPPVTQEKKDETSRDSTREIFINSLTNNGQYRNLPPIQRMSDPKKLVEMRRKMEKNQITNDKNER
jgi:hypothetical protein